MKIKKYQAKSFSAALRAVKKQLGTDAMILSTEDRKDGSSFVKSLPLLTMTVQSPGS